MYPLSKYLSKVLGPLVNTTDYTVRDSEKCVNIVQGMRMEEDEELVSFDVVSLYTNLPIDRAIDAVSSRLQQDDTLTERTALSMRQVSELLALCLKSTFFSFGDSYYWLSDGVAMGSPVSSVVANMSIQEL